MSPVALIQLLECYISFFSLNLPAFELKFLLSLGEAIRPSLNQLCNNVMGHLNQKDFYPNLQVSDFKFVAGIVLISLIVINLKRN